VLNGKLEKVIVRKILKKHFTQVLEKHIHLKNIVNVGKNGLKNLKRNKMDTLSQDFIFSFIIFMIIPILLIYSDYRDKKWKKEWKKKNSLKEKN
jgi:hypothetical protein